MTTAYKDWAPTGLDTKGLGLANRQDWFVAPVTRTRDSDTLGKSNFATFQSMADDACVIYEAHRLDHWACGWIDIILVHPASEDFVREIEDTLTEYPVLSDGDFSAAEYQRQEDDYESWGRREFLRQLADECALSDATVEWLEGREELVDELAAHHETHWDEHSGFEWSSPTRDELARIIREERAS